MEVKNQLLSDRIMNMKESATIKMAQMARNLSAQGHDVINLSLGEPDFDTPQHIKEAAWQALKDGYTKYTPVPGLVSLREAIVEKFATENDLHFDLNQIVVSNGAKQSIANLSLSLLNRGDEAIILAPYWVSYYEIVRLSGATPVIIHAGVEDDFKASPEKIEAAITDKTKFILYSSPCNPTGSVYTREELHEIAKVLERHEHVHIISDEIYEYINFEGEHVSIGSFNEVKDRTITVNGFSKGFAMTGWRIGYMGAPKEIAAACSKMQGQFTSGASAFGQRAAEMALRSEKTSTREMKKAFDSRRKLVIELLGAIPGVKVNKPRGAFYIFPDISHFFGKSNGESTISNANDFCEFLLKEAHVAVVSGSAFGDDNCFRFSYAASESEIREAIRRIEKVLSTLR